MSVTRVPALLRDAVRFRAGLCCEYCLVHEDDLFEPHEADHIIAEQHGGDTTPDNLAFACWDCNRRKGPNISSVDAESAKSFDCSTRDSKSGASTSVSMASVLFR